MNRLSAAYIINAVWIMNACAKLERPSEWLNLHQEKALTLIRDGKRWRDVESGRAPVIVYANQRYTAMKDALILYE